MDTAGKVCNGALMTDPIESPVDIIGGGWAIIGKVTTGDTTVFIGAIDDRTDAPTRLELEEASTVFDEPIICEGPWGTQI